MDEQQSIYTVSAEVCPSVWQGQPSHRKQPLRRRASCRHSQKMFGHIRLHDAPYIWVPWKFLRVPVHICTATSATSAFTFDGTFTLSSALVKGVILCCGNLDRQYCTPWVKKQGDTIFCIGIGLHHFLQVYWGLQLLVMTFGIAFLVCFSYLWPACLS